MDAPNLERDDRPDAARLDRATADRLARLRTMPVDTARLEKRLQAEIPGLSSRVDAA